MTWSLAGLLFVGGLIAGRWWGWRAAIDWVELELDRIEAARRS